MRSTNSRAVTVPSYHLRRVSPHTNPAQPDSTQRLTTKHAFDSFRKNVSDHTGKINSHLGQLQVRPYEVSHDAANLVSVPADPSQLGLRDHATTTTGVVDVLADVGEYRGIVGLSLYI
jgi:hypothetical protein